MKKRTTFARTGVCYMATDTSIYELPIAVADNPRELAVMLGVKPNSISAAICREQNGINTINFGAVKIFRVITGKIKESK